MRHKRRDEFVILQEPVNEQEIMCYHKSLTLTAEELSASYNALVPESVHLPVYHATGFMRPHWPILSRQQPQAFEAMQWGLLPMWTKAGQEAEMQARTLNARQETIFEKPAFRRAAQNGQRCVIPVTGFFEWYTKGGKKYPFYIRGKEPVVSIAGLWEEWTDRETGEVKRTYTVLTTEANTLLAAIHNTKKRMPCLLTPTAEQAWLKENLSEKEVAQLLAEPYPAESMRSHSISRRITARDEDSDVAEVLQPVEYPELAGQTALFQG